MFLFAKNKKDKTTKIDLVKITSNEKANELKDKNMVKYFMIGGI